MKLEPNYVFLTFKLWLEIHDASIHSLYQLALLSLATNVEHQQVFGKIPTDFEGFEKFPHENVELQPTHLNST